MDDNVPDGNPPKDFNKIDLTQLQGFSFGTQWTQDKSSPSERHDQGDHPRRDSRPGGPGGPPDRRDRRAFRRPNSGPESGGPGEQQGGAGGRDAPAGRSQDQGGYRPAGPRYSGPAGERRQRYSGRGDVPERRIPYESPYFSVTFYPEDVSFGALVKTVRTSCRTIELFEIARTVLAKPDRFTVSVSPRQPESAAEPGPERADSPPASAAAKPAAIHICVPDGQPFDSEEAAIAHGLKNHMALFFDTKEVEADPPKGNFQVVNRCGITGELLGPPNYHRYAQTMQRHFESRIGRMSLEEYRTRIESVRDPLVVQQWVDKMRKVTRYFWKLPPEGGTPVPARIDEPKAAPDVTPTAEAAPAEPAPATSEGAASAAPEAAPGVESEATPASGNETAAEAASPGALSFDSLEDARNYLLAQARGRLVRPIGTVRIHGRTLDALPAGEIRRAIEGEYERQSRFPLDTANALRGRLRREHFTIFKKGAKGVSYVCAVKRKFRVPGQTFSESIGGLISFVETHAMIKAGELPAQYLGLPAPAAPVEGAAPTQDLTPEQRDRKRRVEADILWLVREGYVTEFIDGSLYASPPVAEARRTEVEAGEADPENFPEVPEAPGAVDEAPPEAAPASIPAQDVAVEQPAPETSPQAGDPAPPAA